MLNSEEETIQYYYIGFDNNSIYISLFFIHILNSSVSTCIQMQDETFITKKRN